MPSNIRAKVISGLFLFCLGTPTTCIAQGADSLAPRPKQRARSARSLGLEKYEVSKEINLDVSQSRLFKIGAFVARTSVANPSIACPVVLCENQFLIVGSKKGTTSITIWDNTGQVIAMTVNVKDNMSKWSNQSSKLAKEVAFDKKSEPNSGKFALALREGELSEEASKTVARCLALAIKRNALLNVQKSQGKPANPFLASGYTLMIGEGRNGGVHISTGSKAEYEAVVQTRPEFTQTINIPIGQSRTIKTKNKIAKCTVMSPSFLEPIIVSTTETVLLAKSPGSATLIIEDESENIESIEVNCLVANAKLDSPTESVQAKSITSVPAKPMHVTEKLAEEDFSLSIGESRCFDTNNNLVRGAIADEKIADVVFTKSNQITLVGISPGETTLFFWDDKGNSKGIEVLVGNTSTAKPISSQFSKASKPESRHKASAKQSGFTEIEYWSGSRKDVLSVPRRVKP